MRSTADEEFEKKVQDLLNELKTSHTGFRQIKSPTIPGRHAISATFIIFIVLLLLIWKHNRSTYKRQYSKWDRS